MTPDYYKTLGIARSSGDFLIAYKFKHLCRLHLLKAPFNEHKSVCITELFKAYEVLSNDHVRKYYDILYDVYIKQQHLYIPAYALQKYQKIIDNIENKAEQKTISLLKDSESVWNAFLLKPILWLYFIATISVYARGHFLLSPLGGIVTLIFSSILILKGAFENGQYAFLIFFGTILLLLSLINLSVNFCNFTIDLMKGRYSFDWLFYRRED